MVIIEDTRQQDGKHELKHEHFKADGVDLIRCKLPFGDYALPPVVAVDTKKGLEEICANICGSKATHNRFKRECVNARDAGCKLFILVENDDGITDLSQVHTWINPRLVYYPESATGERLQKAMTTMSERYGVTFLFCPYEETAETIERILLENA